MGKLQIEISNLCDPINNIAPFSSTSLNIRGNISISYGNVILTKYDEESPDFLNDAVIFILLELHQIIGRLFYTGLSWRVKGTIGFRFIFNRYAILFYGGENSFDPIITIMVYDSRQNKPIPAFKKIRIRPEELAEEVYSVTSNILKTLIVLENDVMNTALKNLKNHYEEAGEEMKRSPLYKELAFNNLKTEMILMEYTKTKESRTERPIFFQYMGGFSY